MMTTLMTVPRNADLTAALVGASAAALAVAFWGSGAFAKVQEAAPVIAAERAFAADAPSLGIAGSFNKWAAPEAIVIGPAGVQTVAAAFPLSEPRSAAEPALVWWPTFAGIARSGDLGFTTGGVEVDGKRGGHYFTVWKRQADETWKWVYDGGNSASAADAPGPDAEPTTLPTAMRGAMSDDAAWMEVLKFERALAERAATDQAAAHLAVLSEDARVHVAHVAPASGPSGHAAVLARWPTVIAFGETEGGGASQAGDLVWTYGPAKWDGETAGRTGHYVRVWQMREGGWRLVFAQLIAHAAAVS